MIHTTSKTYQVLLLGDTEVGKTTLFTKWTPEKPGDNKSLMLIKSEDLISKTTRGTTINLKLHDCSGGQHYRNQLKPYHAEADVVLFLFDLSKKESYDLIPEWVETVTQANKNPNLIFFLIGNKNDQKREIESEEVKRFADSSGMIYVETSVLEQIETDKLLRLILARIENQQLRENFVVSEEKKITVREKPPSTPTEYKISIGLIGDSGVGKTALSKYFNSGQSCNKAQYMITIGSDFYPIRRVIGEKCYKINIWDTAGQEIYQAITKSYLNYFEAVLVVYDVTSKRSFEKVNFWLEKIQEHRSDFYMVLVGNKCDMEDQREISSEVGRYYATTHGFSGFFETSALNGAAVEECLSYMIVQIAKLKEFNKLLNINGAQGLELKTQSKRKQKGCCLAK